MCKVAIADIIVHDRIRKDYGDIGELAADIQKNGLIQPIVISRDNVLLCGDRRLKACQSLGMVEIDAVTRDAADARRALMLEISENESRKPFTVSERLAYAAQLLPIAQEEARERQRGRRDERERIGKTRDIVAQSVGFGSGSTFRRAQAVHDSGENDLIEAMDAGEISIRRAYDELTRRVKDQQATIDAQAATIQAYEEAEDEQSDAYEALAIECETLKTKLRAAEASGNYHDRDIIVQNTIDKLIGERDDALAQRDEALDVIEKRIRPIVARDPAAALFVKLGKVVADVPEDQRKKAAEILETAYNNIVALST